MKYTILVILVTLIITLVPLNSTIHAQDSNPYYSYSYQIGFSKGSVLQNEVFAATIEGEGTCNVDLIVTVNSVEISGVIYGLLDDKKIVLNGGFKLAIQDLPNSRGQSFVFEETIPLMFPAGSPPGRYDIYVQMDGLRTQVLGIWIDDSGNISKTPFLVGSVECLPATLLTPDDNPASSPPTSTASPVPGTSSNIPPTMEQTHPEAIFIFITLLMLAIFAGIMVKISRDIHASA